LSAPCKRPKVRQISTGQAGPQVNRDLETLFGAVNSLIECVSRVSDFLDSSHSGGFAGGSGSGGSGGGGGVVQPTLSLPGKQLVVESSSTDVTVPDGFDGHLFLTPAASIAVQMGRASYGGVVRIWHAGTSNTITLKDENAATIGTLKANERAVLVASVTAAGTITWGSVLVYGGDGKLKSSADVVFRSSSAGPVLLDTTDGKYYRVKSTNGVLGVTDLGTSEPVSSTPAEPPA